MYFNLIYFQFTPRYYFWKIVHDLSWEIFKKRKKGKLELVIAYCTLIVVLTGGDNAVGLSTDSQTNAVAE